MSAKGTSVLHNTKIKILWGLCIMMHFGFTVALSREPSIREIPKLPVKFSSSHKLNV